MQLTQSEENRNRLISATATLLIFALFILFLILFKLITPNPPFPESGGGGGQELALGMMNVGTGDLDYNNMGEVQRVETEKTENENIVTDENGEDVDLKESKPEEKKEDKMVIKPIKPQPVVKEPVKELTPAEKLALKFKKTTGKNGGGIGNTDVAGQNGSPVGDPFKNGTGGTGTGSDGGNGVGIGPGGPGPGSGGGPGGEGKYGVDLRGRKVMTPPKLPTDLQKEGKVVVEITVDDKGNVIEANPNGRGTTTSDPMLKAKAKQAAMGVKFNVDSKFEEQRGTITIIFSFD